MRVVLLLILLLVAPVILAKEAMVQLQAGRQLALGVLVSGVVQDIRVTAGQKVNEGELLLKLDQQEFKARLRRAKAMLARAKSLHEEALREEQRAQELYDRTLLSDHELQKARIQRLEAESRKQDAAADVVEAKLNLERSRVVAPMEGRVLEVKAWQGQPVQNACQIQPLILFGVAGSARFSLPLSDTLPVNKVQVRVNGQWQDVSRFHVEQQAENRRFLQGWVETRGIDMNKPLKVRWE